jgi:hypothetical protein
LLRKSISCFGYNPRLCFRAARSEEALEKKKMAVTWRITDVARNGSNISQLLHSFGKGDSDVSHSIFEVSPKKDEKRQLSDCKFGIVSRWAMQVLLTAYEAQKADAAVLFYHTISGPSAASLRGHIFERQVLEHLKLIGTECEFPIRGLAAPEETIWTYRGPMTNYTFLEDSDFISNIVEAVQAQTPLHLVPSAPNFPTVDSILYDPNEGLTCIQITIGEQHPIRVSGFKRLQKWLKADHRLAGLVASPENPWRFIFVMPPGETRADPFGLQRLVGNAGDQDEWAGMMRQYVLELDVLGERTLAVAVGSNSN